MKKIVVSAPGKLHLSGEHAVVYGKPALVVAISKRLYVTLEYQTSHSTRSVQAGSGQVTPVRRQSDTSNESGKDQGDIGRIRNDDHYIGRIIDLIENKYQLEIRDVSLTINSSIPKGAGMGSSAALATALTGALLTYIEKPWDLQNINELSFKAEKIKHGNPSGGDPTVITHGGLLWYRKELDFLKTFWLLPFKMPKKFSPFILFDTGRHESVKEMVENRVGSLQKKNPDAFIVLLSKIEETTRQIAIAIHDEDEKSMRVHLRSNELLLEEMGVVSQGTQKLIRQIESVGGVAKISGAGGIKTGSGIIIAIHDKPQVLIDLAKKYNVSPFQVELGSDGVRREQVVV